MHVGKLRFLPSGGGSLSLRKRLPGEGVRGIAVGRLHGVGHRNAFHVRRSEFNEEHPDGDDEGRNGGGDNGGMKALLHRGHPEEQERGNIALSQMTIARLGEDHVDYLRTHNLKIVRLCVELEENGEIVYTYSRSATSIWEG